MDFYNLGNDCRILGFLVEEATLRISEEENKTGFTEENAAHFWQGFLYGGRKPIVVEE